MPRLVVVLPLEPLDVGAAFPLSTWPLHVTIAPTFQIERDADSVASVLEKVVAGTPALILVSGHREGFGRSNDLPVTLIEQSHALGELHARMMDALEAGGAVFDDPDFVRSGFRAHVTRTRLAELEPGGSVVARQLALVDMAPLGEARLRRTVWTWPLPL